MNPYFFVMALLKMIGNNPSISVEKEIILSAKSLSK
jgi:hypothetical protein